MMQSGKGGAKPDWMQNQIGYVLPDWIQSGDKTNARLQIPIWGNRGQIGTNRARLLWLGQLMSPEQAHSEPLAKNSGIWFEPAESMKS